MKRKILLALGIGVLMTVILTTLAFFINSRKVSRVLVWQAALLVDAVPAHNIGTPEKPFYEGTPLHLFAFGLGVLLGVPIYAFLAYVTLSLFARRRDSP
jgi:hypothetical protein